jgi:hypothetical protein
MPYPQRRCIVEIEFRRRKQQRRFCSVRERLFMVAAAVMALFGVVACRGPRLQGFGVQEGGGGTLVTRRIGRQRFYTSSISGRQSWAGAVQGGVQGAHRG